MRLRNQSNCGSLQYPDAHPATSYMDTDRTLFALALLTIDGVGRVTAGRVLSRFADLDDLHRYPREQVLHRIKGARNGEALVNNLFDEAFLDDHISSVRRQLKTLTERNINVLVLGDENWPPGFDDLEPSERPVLLYGYGNTENLALPGISVFARPPLDEAPFEWAESLVQHLASSATMVIGGVANGFDNVVQKLASDASHSHPSVMIAHCGLAKIPSGLRSTAAKAVQSGSLMISSFPMGHGPYDHDNYERALLQAALGSASVFIQPRPDSPEWRALQWACTHTRTAYVVADDEHAPPPGAAIIDPQTPVQDISIENQQI